MAIVQSILLLVLQAVWLLLLAPLLAGVMHKVKAMFQGRRGPRILQPYYDIIKYMHKEAVFSKHRSWLTVAVPYIVFTATLVSGLVLPIIGTGFGLFGDILLFIYIFAIARLFTALAALDTASSFGGMGATREMAINTVIEPAFILALLAVIIQTKTTNLLKMTSVLEAGSFYVSLPYILTFVALFLVVLGETGKIPIDNEDTHLELTMIHEGMVLEYSGRYLGLMVYSTILKQFIFISMFVFFFLPFLQPEVTGIVSAIIAVVLFTVKVFLVGIFVSFIEVMYAKVRLYQVPKLFVTSMTLSFLAIIVHLVF